jgi:hypothetical protein
MRKTLALIGTSVLLVGCTFAHVSSTPMLIEGVGKVHRYEGRSNFSHQLEKADAMMAATCKKENGGYPIIVDLRQKDLGVIALGSGQSTTNLNANSYGSSVYGTATTSSYGSVNAMRNQNQVILFKCDTKLDN